MEHDMVNEESQGSQKGCEVYLTRLYYIIMAMSRGWVHDIGISEGSPSKKVYYHLPKNTSFGITG
jgi:hypothetical protein